MAVANAAQKSLAFKKETAWDTAAGVSGGQLLRRVTSDLALERSSFRSAEKVNHQQRADMRLGVKSVPGTINGELSPGTYKAFIQSLLRRDFTTGVNSTALVNVTAAAGPPGTFTRAAGSFLTDGFKIGDIIRWAGWTTTATANNARNYRITALTATVMTVGTAATGVAGQPEAVIAKAAGDSVTATVVGKKTFIPVTGHITDSYSIEHWFADVAQSELFTGCRIGSMQLSLPSEGMATVRFGVLGRNMIPASAQYFTTPTAPTTAGIAAAVNGLLRVGASDNQVVTGIDLTVDFGLQGTKPAVGSILLPGILYGPQVSITGQLTAYFEDAVIRDAFIAETESQLAIQLALGSGIAADFLTLVMSRIKFTGAQKDDGDRGIEQTLPFEALLDTVGGTGIATENTSLSIQDTLA